MKSQIRLRHVLRPREVTGRAHLQVLSVYRDHGVVPKDSRNDNFNKTPADLSRYQEVRVGDLVVNKMKAWQGSLAISGLHGIVSPDYQVCSVDQEVNSRFVHYLLKSSSLIAEYGTRSKGIRPAQWRLYWGDLADISVEIPEESEQRRIADFLDAETARIDDLLKLTNSQIETLDERRRSCLGLAMSQDHYPSVRLGYLASLVTSGPRGWGDYVGENGVPFFRSANLQRNDIEPNLSELARVDPPIEANAEANRSRIRDGDILIGITGANTGWVAFSSQSLVGANVSQHVCLVRPGAELDSTWLAYFLTSPAIQESLLGSQYGGTKTQLSLPDIRGIRVPRAPLSEQVAVARSLADTLQVLREQGNLRFSWQTLLQERRQALITAAVTGQFDVTTARGVDVS